MPIYGFTDLVGKARFLRGPELSLNNPEQKKKLPGYFIDARVSACGGTAQAAKLQCAPNIVS